MTSGYSESVEDQFWITTHAALMTVAMVCLMPLGIIVARNKWLFRDVMLFGLHIWFHLHRTLQYSAIGIFVAGFVVAFVKLGSFPDTAMGKAHYGIGLALMIMIGIMVRTPSHGVVLVHAAEHHTLRVVHCPSCDTCAM
jgi:hypothetical protein